MEEKKEEDFLLQVRILSSGELKLDGNVLNNEPLALYMLEKAKDMIKVHCAELAQSLIKKPQGGIMNFVRKGRF